MFRPSKPLVDEPDEMVNGYGYSGGVRKYDEYGVEYSDEENIPQPDYEIFMEEENKRKEEEEKLNDEEIKAQEEKEYELLTYDEQEEYDKYKKGEDSHNWILKLLFGNTPKGQKILKDRAKENEEKQNKEELKILEILQNKEQLEAPTGEGSRARMILANKYTQGQPGDDVDDEIGRLNQHAFENYILDKNKDVISIDSLLTKNKQYATADIVIKNRNDKPKELIEVKTVNFKKDYDQPIFWCPINKISNMYGYPDGIDKTNQERLKEIKTFKNPNIKRTIYWTVLSGNKKEKIEDIKGFAFPEEIKKVYKTKENAKESFKDRLSFFDLNNKELKSDILKYRKDNKYRPTNKDYMFEIGDKSKQMTVKFSNPKKLTNVDYPFRKIDFID